VAKTNPIQAQKFLGCLDYPASKNEIARHAKQNGADKNVLDVPRRVPNRQYDGPTVVSHEISGAR
jgi:hypothetical protein